MTDIYDQFLAEDDDILASVLEASLRHYNEVEVPLRSINVAPTLGPSCVTKNTNSPIEIVDLCQSPKKCSTVQSRLSSFFRKPLSDKITNIKIHNEAETSTEEINIDTNSPLEPSASISNSPCIFYKKPDADGFHLSSGSHYVYPSNFPVREYQMDIIKTALFHNTLVSLPTGLGKTFIAAVVMYNFYRWYPMGKIVFMAPTRPLVAQQIEACHSIMGIPKEMTFEMTGNIPPEQRYLAWNKYRVFFLTPQVMANDLSLNKCPSKMLRCIIIDEAHRATKDYAYAQVLRQLFEENRVIRIVGLSATPGTTAEAVGEVVRNLNISKLEFRTEESPDVAKYINKKDVECISVKLSNDILNLRTQFLAIYDKYSRRLKQYRALNGNVTNLTKFQILGAKQKFVTSNLAREMPKSLVGCLINDFTVCMSLAYALELLTVYGIKVFYLQLLELSENHACLSNDADLQKILHRTNKELSSQELTWSHPKLFELKKIVQNYFGSENTDSNSKIIIFCQYRLVVVEVFELLKTFSSAVKPVMFVGQSLKEKGGLPQKKQLEVMSRFKSGDFNVLIATSVAEEGLDIGEVDLIICLEANKSPIKFVQRLGRTGRKRSGKCITLLTEGKEQMKYKSSVNSSKTLVMKMLKNNLVLSNLAHGGPRLVPKHVKPQCLMIHVKPPEEVLPSMEKGKGKKKVQETLMQFVQPNNEHDVTEEKEDKEGFEVFQNNKLKRKPKKRKIAETNDNCREFESIEDLHKKQNSVEVDCSLPGNNALDEAENDRNILDRFVEEEKAFNEWLQSCEQIDSIVMNEPFLKLLNLFTNCTIDGKESDSKSLICKTDGQPKIRGAGESGFDDLFRSQGIHGDCIINDINWVDNKVISTAPIHGSNKKRAYCDYGKNTDFEVYPKSPKLNNSVYDDRYEEFVVKHLNDSKLSIRSNGRQNSPEICSGRYKSESIKPKEDERARKFDFDELFKNPGTSKSTEDKNQVYDEAGIDTDSEDLFKSPELNRNVVDNKKEIVVEKSNSNEPIDGRMKSVAYSENYKVNNFEPKKDRLTRKIDFDELFTSQTAETDMFVENYNDTRKPNAINREVTDKLRHEVVDIGRIADRDDATAETMIPVEYDVDDEDDIFLGNVDFENLFKSQRAEAYIENYNDQIVSEQLDDGSDHSVGPINIKRRSPMICSDRKKIFDKNSITPVEIIDSGEPFRSRKAGVEKMTEDVTIDLIHNENDNEGHTGVIKLDTDRKGNRCTGSINQECLFDVQPANKYIEDYMIRTGLPPRKKVVPVSDGDDDDVISLNSSPEFFSLKLPKKTVQKKLTECVQAPVEDDEIVDLSTPPPREPHPAVGQLKLNDRFPLTDAACDSRSKNDYSENRATTNIFGGGYDDGDDDDMDFMFVDYCSGGTSADVFTQRLQPVENSGTDVFTQKQQIDKSDTDVFTQKQHIDKSGTDVFTQKQQIDISGNDVFTQKPWVEKRDTEVFAQEQLADDYETKQTRRSLLAKETTTSSLMDRKPTSAAVDDHVTAAKTVLSTTSKPSVLNGRSSSSKAAFPQPSNILKAYNLLKPGFSLKRNTATTSKRQQNVDGDKPVTFNRVQQVGNNSMTFNRKHLTDDKPVTLKRPQVGDTSMTFNRPQRADSKPSAVSYTVNQRLVADNVSPVPSHSRWMPRLSQSTPKIVKGTSVQKKQQQQPTVPTVAPRTVNSLLTSSSSDSDAIFDNKANIRNRVKKKRRRKPKKKLLFIDDEADVSNCGDTTMVAANVSSSSDDNTEDEDFDSSFIDDDHEKTDPSTSMTIQYLQSIKNQGNARGTFKIPTLSTQHYNINVYSQMEDRNDNSYEEDSFCVRDASDLSVSRSSNTSSHDTSEEQPSKQRKRKRILLPQSSSSDDSPDQFNRKMARKRSKVKTSLIFS